MEETTLRIKKELLTEIKKISTDIVGYSMFMSAASAIEILLTEYKKLTNK